MPSRSIFRENLPNGGRGCSVTLKKGRGHTIAFTAVAFNAGSDHICSLISSTFAYWYQMIHSIGFLAAVMAGEVVPL